MLNASAKTVRNEHDSDSLMAEQMTTSRDCRLFRPERAQSASESGSCTGRTRGCVTLGEQSTMLIEVKTRSDNIPLALNPEIIISFSGSRLLTWICGFSKDSHVIMGIESRGTTLMPETVHRMLSLTGREVDGPYGLTSGVLKTLSSFEVLDELEFCVDSSSPSLSCRIHGTRVSATIYSFCNKYGLSPSSSEPFSVGARRPCRRP